MILKGEYKNGKRWNWIIKEYYEAGILQFEGEYFNGKRWNEKVKEYELKLEGKYLNGEKI